MFFLRIFVVFGFSQCPGARHHTVHQVLLRGEGEARAEIRGVQERKKQSIRRDGELERSGARLGLEARVSLTGGPGIPGGPLGPRSPLGPCIQS